jgi:glucose/arabinose dehydrogenase
MVLAALVGVLAVVVYLRIPADLELGSIELPAGFMIAVFADSLPGARSMGLGDSGKVFIGTQSEGLVYAVWDSNGDGRADRRVEIDRDLYMPNGVAFHDGALYVAAVSQVLRYDRIESSLDDPPGPAIVRSDLPGEGWHGWRYIAFGPDGKLYIAIGAPCNSCRREDERFATIVRMNPDGSEVEIMVRGVRNSVGFDWHPTTGDMWFTDNGRDWLGNDAPPDELNRVVTVGGHFGFPYCHGGTIPDEDFTDRSCDEFVPPVQQLDPHVASLGLRFYTGTMFPESYRGQIFIAEHGSWNRIPPSGYRITMVRLDGNRPVSYEPFAVGWLRAGRASGTPADLLILSDGSMLVSDDRAGKIYRIVHR